MEIRGIIHAHSNYSYDAKLSLVRLREEYIRAGLRFACMTEHTDAMSVESARSFVRECELLSDEQFIFIPGFEVPYKRAHVLMIGQRIFFDAYAPTIEVLRRWTKECPMVILAHPVRNHFEVDEGLLSEIDALEVWNQQYEGKRVPRTRSLRLFKTLREKKIELLATGGVDFHRREHLGAPFVTCEVAILNESQIIEQLRKGAYTISSAHTSFEGTLTNIDAMVRAHRGESAVSVSIIMLGKWVNKICATFGFSLPKSWKRMIRRTL
ncbi:MAG TPA: PHP domain-containing protein [Candidatus Paceibacterota bacterium]|nr:PHP domain-containing protein [Candidatus Paceibacterota bacterium]